MIDFLQLRMTSNNREQSLSCCEPRKKIASTLFVKPASTNDRSMSIKRQILNVDFKMTAVCFKQRANILSKTNDNVCVPKFKFANFVFRQQA